MRLRFALQLANLRVDIPNPAAGLFQFVDHLIVPALGRLQLRPEFFVVAIGFGQGPACQGQVILGPGQCLDSLGGGLVPAQNPNQGLACGGCFRVIACAIWPQVFQAEYVFALGNGVAQGHLPQIG